MAHHLTPRVQATGRRADARRNYARILTVADEEVASFGADASLERIARRSGVGSATVRRHFPGRQALLEAVFSERIDAICSQARAMTEAADSRTALREWLGLLAAYASTARGLTSLLVRQQAAEPVVELDQSHPQVCSAKLGQAADLLLRPAKTDGAVPPDLTSGDLIALVTGVVLASEHHADPHTSTRRLLDLMMDGISPQVPRTHQAVTGPASEQESPDGEN